MSKIRSGGAYSEHRAKLEELGFNYDVRPKDIRGFDKIYSALKAYKAVHGNLLIHKSFIVPHGDVNFPPETWGMKLGGIVQNIRYSDSYSEHKVKLEELGFVYKTNKKVVVSF